MSAVVSSVEAGRIRDAARLTTLGGLVALVSFFLSFPIEQAIYGFAVWPIAFGLMAVAILPIIRPAGLGIALVVTLIGVFGAVVEVLGVVAPPVSGTALRISPIFGAGMFGIGAWWIGMAALAKLAATLPVELTAKGLRTGLGFGVVGASWFVEDLLISLLLLAAGVWLMNGITPLVRHLRSYGLPLAPEVAVPGDAVSA